MARRRSGRTEYEVVKSSTNLQEFETVKIVGNFSVRPPLPQTIHRLQEMAYNLWWTWNPDAQDLYESIDKELWEKG